MINNLLIIEPKFKSKIRKVYSILSKKKNTKE